MLEQLVRHFMDTKIANKQPFFKRLRNRAMNKLNLANKDAVSSKCSSEDPSAKSVANFPENASSESITDSSESPNSEATFDLFLVESLKQKIAEEESFGQDLTDQGAAGQSLTDKSLTKQNAIGEITVLDLTPRPTHIQGHVSVKIQNTTSETLRIRVLGSDFETVTDDYIFMGETDLEFSEYTTDKATLVNASLFIPWNLEDIYVVAWNKDHPEHLTYKHLTKQEWESLVATMDDWLYKTAGNDPYYTQWFSEHRVSAFETKRQRTIVFPSIPHFSIVVPLYKTPLTLFDEMAFSVSAQTYPNWECILVNSTPEDSALSERISERAKDDSRFRIVTLEKNLGISLNTNAGLEYTKGDFVCFLDHDDALEPDILFEYAKAINEHPNTDLIYCDEDKIDEAGAYCMPTFKTDFNLDLLRSCNYICHMLCIRKTLLDQLEPNTPEFDGAQDHNLTLEAVEKARHIHHVSRILYHWRMSPNSASGNDEAKPYATRAGILSVQNHLNRIGVKASVSQAEGTSFGYKVSYEVPADKPLVSILIPSKDHIDLLKRCVDSIVNKSTYDNFEIIVIENNSTDPNTFDYYQTLETMPNTRVVRWPEQGFNFSAIVNFGRKHAQGDYLVLLNNDTAVITPDWIEHMLSNCARKEVGAVGCKLYYPDDTLQHAGCIVIEGVALSFRHLPREGTSYLGLVNTQRNVSAVAGACLMVSTTDYDAVGGLDEALSVEYNDIDFCLKLLEAGKLNVLLPDVELYHYESFSRGALDRGAHYQELCLFEYRWSSFIGKGDPYYNINLQPRLDKVMHWKF